MHEAIRIFREINQFYRDRYENEDSKLFFELMSANQHTSKNNHEIALLQMSIKLLDSSKKCLPFIIDLLNGHDIHPTQDIGLSQASWTEKRAGCRFSKCIDRLEKGHLEEGLILMKEVVQLFCEVISQYEKSCYDPGFIAIHTSTLKRHNNTLLRCFTLLEESDQHLPLVIGVFKGDKKLPESVL